MTGESSIERLRLFVAIPVPDAVREKMICVQNELQPLAPHGAVRWTKPEQFHLTLRFLGNVASGRVADLQNSIRAACAGVPALPLRALGVGFFPSARAPRVVWIGVNDDDHHLLGLQRKIEGAVKPFTMEAGTEHFAGHLTLGRFKRSRGLEIRNLASRAKEMEQLTFGEWTAETVELVRSELSKIGTTHSVLETFPLNQIEPA